MTTSYKYKVSYLNDPYQQFLMHKEQQKANANTNNQILNPAVIKKDHRTTKLLLDVNEFGVFSQINIGNDAKINNGLVTPPSSLEESSEFLENYSKNKMNINNEKLAPPSANNGMLAPPSTNNGMLAPPSTEGDTMNAHSIKAKKHSSFLNPLMNMSFEVGGLFGDGDITSDDLFGEMLSKYDNMATEEIGNKTLDELKKENRLSQDTIKMRHSSTIKGSGTFKGNTSNLSIQDIQDRHTSQDTIKMKHSSTIKGSGVFKGNTSSLSIQDTQDKHTSQDTIKLLHNDSMQKIGSSSLKENTSSLSIQDSQEKHVSQDTIKLLNNDSVKKVDSFDNQLVQNLNSKPSIVIDKTFLNNVEEADTSKGFDPEIYKEDEKIDFSSTKYWENPWKSDDEERYANEAESMKSSQSKLSAFSNFTLKSSKKLGKMTKKFYKKLVKQKETPQFPKSPLDIPDSYNEKERAFEEMILRDDTISLSLSNPNGTLTSTFADKAFPLPEGINDNSIGNNTENMNDTENAVENNFVNSSFISNINGEEEELINKKKRHRNGINFEEALKEGNNFRMSLANMD